LLKLEVIDRDRVRSEGGMAAAGRRFWAYWLLVQKLDVAGDDGLPLLARRIRLVMETLDLGEVVGAIDSRAFRR
jgi:hypothetical protein